MMGHSLADDGDLTYRRQDLVRVWREFPSRPVRRVPEARPRHRRCGLMCARRSSGPDPPDPIRSATSTASRSSIRCSRRRSCGSSAPTGFSCSTRCCSRWSPWCGYLFLHARMRRVAVGGARRRVRHGVGRPGLFRLDHAGAVQLLARRSSPTSAGCTRRWKRRSVRRAARAGCSAARAIWPRRCSSASRRFRRSRMRCCSCRVSPGCCGGGDGARAVAAGVVFARVRRRAVPASTWRSPASGTSRAGIARTFVWEFPFQNADVDASRSALPMGARRIACRGHLRPARVLDEPGPQPRVLLRRPVCRDRRRISSRRSSRSLRS